MTTFNGVVLMTNFSYASSSAALEVETRNSTRLFAAVKYLPRRYDY
jgi:hypothetical protein